MKTVLQIFFRPEKTFNELQQEEKFPVTALVILLFLMAVNSILLVPVTTKVMAMTMSSLPLSEEQMDRTLAFMYKLRYLLVLGGLISFAAVLFIKALVLYVVTIVAKPSLTYMESVTLIVFCYFAVILGDFLNTGLLYHRGIDAITNPYEISQTGLNLLTTVEEAGLTVYTFLSLINPFQIGFFLLLAAGIKVFAGIRYRKALIISIIFWIITLIYAVGTAFYAQTALEKTGIL